jgi:hypothetical protein
MAEEEYEPTKREILQALKFAAKNMVAHECSMQSQGKYSKAGSDMAIKKYKAGIKWLTEEMEKL